ncbi:hypothetical protein [Streptomyces sp. NPDC046685]|uniref:hypothetical protein n=1 Tax=Streptomyces sp. NPDC046685 TaxID=3157202 RepID=UPI0033D264C5
MSHLIIHSCASGVRGIDTQEGPWPQPSQALLDRARVGWERFLETAGELTDD